MEGKLYRYFKTTLWILISAFTLLAEKAMAQLPSCDPNVPYYNVNLVGSPSGVWISPPHSRNGHCCSATGADNCTSFEVTLDSNAVALSFNFVSGAVPTGALYYQINCGPVVPVGQPICISGPGPHRITFCKPGNNQNTYSITSISVPTAPPNDTIRKGCNMNIDADGMIPASITWNSIYPGTPGQYNSYLSCTSGCSSPNFNPDDNAPEFIHYQVCGQPIADQCGYDINFCDTVIIRTLDRLEAFASPSPAVICSEGGTLTLMGSATGGDGNYQYIWKDANGNILVNTQNYTINAGGAYTLEVVDGLFGPTCPSALVNVPVQLSNAPVVNAGPDQVLCGSATSVSLNGSVTNSSGGSWIGGNGIFSPSRNSLIATYSPTPAEIASGGLTLVLGSTGSSGCPNKSDTIRIDFSPLLVASLPNDTVPCYGQSISFGPTVSGGTPPYTYAWNDDTNGSTITAGAGNYCVTVTDAAGCQITVCGQIINPDPLGLTMSKNDVSVVAGTDGSATANPSGGTLPYTYLWNNGETTQTISNLSSGIYSVTVTDANGCTINGSIGVNEPTCLGFGVNVTYTNPLCNGAGNGTATVTVSGGVLPLQYNWSNGETTASISGLTPGVYTVIVTDVNLCQTSASVTLIDPPLLTAISSHTDVTIVGGNNGTASVSPAGGTTPYTYNWSNGGTTASIDTLLPGTYTYTVTDANGCSVTGTVVIVQPDCGNHTVTMSSTNVNCKKQLDGTATATMNFGIEPYTYSWNTGQTAQTATGLGAGTYFVTVTDSVNCSVSASVTITEPDSLLISGTTVNVSCNGAFNGSINTSVTGGTFPYYYSWSNGVTAADPVNLFAGTYSVTVTDAKGCTIASTYEITQPQELILTYTKTDASCNGSLNGAIDITVSGGTQPFTYSWSSGQSTEDLNGVGAGSYVVTVSDANDCKVVSVPSILIDEPEILLTSNVSVQCPLPGDSTTQVTVIPQGGVAPYQVSFDNGATYGAPGAYSASLPTGASYMITLIDANGCVSPGVFNFTIPANVVLSNVTFNPCVTSGASTIDVTASVTGGTGPYQISWNNGSAYGPAGIYSTSLTFNNEYTVIAMDANGCASLPYTITLPDSISLTATAATFTGGNNISCAGAADGSINTAVGGGTAAYTYNWNGPGGFTSTQANISNLAAGVYTVIVSDANGCTQEATVALKEPVALASSFIPGIYNGGYHVSCNGASNGSIQGTVTGGTAPYLYDWTGPGGFTSSSEDISSLIAGTYSVTVTDANGCSITATVNISEPPVLASTYTAATFNGGYNISCNGMTDGSISGSVSGGTSPYTYAWTGPGSFNATTEDITDLSAGVYTVNITDANGCTTSSTIVLIEPGVLGSTFNPQVYNGGYNISCNGLSDGSLTGTVSGGTQPYQFVWTGPSNFTSTQQDISGLAAGTYSITITDANGCVTNGSYTLSSPDVLTASATGSSYNGFGVSCYNGNDGEVQLTVNGGSPNYLMSWTGPNGYTSTAPMLSGVKAGTYSAVITDQNNCSTNVSISLTEPDAIVLSATTKAATCGTSNGTVDLTVTGGIFPYGYQWSNGVTTEDLSGCADGSYNVTVSDQNNCLAVYTIAVTKVDVMQVSSTVKNDSCYGGTDGRIELEVINGTAPYTFTWSDGSNSQELLNLAAGTYSVAITDAEGCSYTGTFNVTQPDKLVLTATAGIYPTGYHVSEAGGADGAITTTVTGGNQPYEFLWTTGSTEQNITNLSAGVYTVTCNAGGCITSATVELKDPLALEMPSAFSPNGDGANDLFVVRGLDAYPTNKIIIVNRWGNEVYSQMNYMNTWNGTNKDGKELPDGTYFVILEIQGENLVLKGYVDLRR